jgi:nucleotide-binding universal stress UspA family protein
MKMKQAIAEHPLVCIHQPPVSDQWVGYTAYLSALLGSQPLYRSSLSSGDWPGVGSADSDLIIYDDAAPTWKQRWLRWAPACNLVAQSPGPILFARQPRWPLRHILLIVRAEQTGEAALAWVERLALLSGAAVTLLPIVPPFPRLHQSGGSLAHTSLDVLLAPNSACGARLLHYASRLQQRHIPGNLYHRQGSPATQIRRQIRETDDDLIVIAAEPYGRLERWFLGELVGPLLSWVNRPVLVAK